MKTFISIYDLYTLFISCNQKITTDTRQIEKGSIFFALKGDNFDANEFAISAIEQGGEIEIAIQDGGPGIPAGQESTIFDLMVTNKESGSGIGLWLTKNIINRNGGDITASNKVGGGACFTIKLPNT